MIAIIISVLAPFFASGNTDCLDGNMTELVWGWNEKHAMETTGVKTPIEYGALQSISV